MRKIKYTCKNCGWETSIWEEWSDLKPARCMNKKCNTSFRLHPDALIITRPQKAEQVQVKQETQEPQTSGKKHGKKSKD